jgi:hypothetical protein
MQRFYTGHGELPKTQKKLQISDFPKVRQACLIAVTADIRLIKEISTLSYSTFLKKLIGF